MNYRTKKRIICFLTFGHRWNYSPARYKRTCKKCFTEQDFNRETYVYETIK